MKHSEAVCFNHSYAGRMSDDDPAWTTTNNFDVDYVHIYQYEGQYMKIMK